MKKIISLVLVGFMSLSACTVKDQPPVETGIGEETPLEEPAGTPVNVSGENKDVIFNFEERLKTADDPLVIKPTMEEIMKTESKETNDAVLSAYLRYLRTYQFMGMTPYYDEFQKLQPYFDKGTQNLSSDSITDVSLKETFSRFESMGYKFIQLEGSVEPIINYHFVENYTNLISGEMIDYGKFKSLDSDQMWASDGGIVISIEELGDRIASAETFLKTYPDSKHKSDVVQDLKNYLHGYFGGLLNTPVVTTDGYTQSFINAYETYLKIHPDTATSKVLQTYYDELKASSFAAPYDENDPASTLHFRERIDGMANKVIKEFGSVVSDDHYVKTSENLNLRNAPELTGEILWVIPKGTIVKASMIWKDWVRIESAGWSGYAKMGYLTQIVLNPEKHRMTSLNLNLRQEPNLESPILMVIPAQTIVEVESIINDWGKTTYAGKTGYVSMTYLLNP
jgi:uncharacterized protein YgiM (DUF1202 family)